MTLTTKSVLDKCKCAARLLPFPSVHCTAAAAAAAVAAAAIRCILLQKRYYCFLGRSSDGSVGVWKCSNRVLDRNKSGHQWDRKMSRKSIIPWYRIYMGRMPQLQECVICILLTLGYIEFGTQLNQTYCHQRAKVMSSGQVLSLQLSFWKGM